MENVVRHVIGGVAAASRGNSLALTVFAPESEFPAIREFAQRAELVPIGQPSDSAVLEREIASGGFDILLCPLLTLEPLVPPIPSIVLIPDLQHEFHPDYFSADVLSWRKRTYRPSALHADHILTLSEHAKNTMTAAFQVTGEKITVLPLGVDVEFMRPADEQTARRVDALALPEQFAYYPANFWPHKNHRSLLQAFSELKAGNPRLGLVLTGARTAGTEEVERQIAELGLEETVRLLEYQPRAVVAEILRRAAVLVFVSKFEGFGLPLAEAFYAEVPIITSNLTSCPEVAGDAAIYVDPDQPREIANAIRRILDDRGLARKLVAAGKARRQRYSWERAVGVVLDRIDATARSGERQRTVQVQEYPRVSIVTPSYNKGPFIEETIQSVLGQDYPLIDYVVMDGGSTDGTLEILKKYKHRLRYVSQRDGGQADAINKGLRLSNAPVCTFLNADDTYLPGAVGTAVGHMMRAPGMAVVYGEGYYTDESGNQLGRYPTLPFDPDYLAHNCYICQPSAFVWRRVYDEVGGIDNNLQFSLDYDLWMKIAERHSMLKVDDFLATSRMYAANKTVSGRRMVYEETIKVVRRHHGYVPFDWILGYSTYLLDRNGSFFDPPAPSASHYALALPLGLYHNKRSAVRYLNEWRAAVGLGPPFTGRWGDGWISKRYITHISLSEEVFEIVIAGRYPDYLPRGQRLTVLLDGKPLGRRRLGAYGPFTLQLRGPILEREGEHRLEIRCNKAVRVNGDQDPRLLGCMIDSITWSGMR